MTTLDSLQDNAGIAVDYVAAIEGFGVLLCSGSPAAALTAWSGTDWSEAVGGLSVSGRHGQSLDPWRPFGEASTITLTVVACPGQSAGDDRFAEDVWNRTGGTASEITTSIDCDDTSVVVKRADDFAASGTLYLDNEALAYSSRDTGTDTFTVSTRGKWSPFRTESDGRFAHPHRFSDSSIAQGVLIPPEVTSRPRSWIGRWVGVWMHRRLGTTLDTKADAHLMFAGRIKELAETESGMTQVVCEDVRASIHDAVILRDQYRARLKEGIFLPRGVTFSGNTWKVTSDVTASGPLDDLVVVPSGAADEYEINEGQYTVEQIASYLNAWLDAEYSGGGISIFQLTYTAVALGDDGHRGRLTLYDPVNDDAQRTAEIRCSDLRVAKALGWNGHKLWMQNDSVNDQLATADTPNAPMRVLLMQRPERLELKLEVEDPRGTWVDQATLLPAALRLAGDAEGILRVGEFGHVMAYVTGTNTFGYFPAQGIWAMGPGLGDLSSVGLSYDDEGSLDVEQVLIAESSFKTLLRTMLSSTGTASFNNTYDTLGETLGCGIPHTLINSLVDFDLANIAHAEQKLTVFVDKPTKFSELFAADFILRKCFLVWKGTEMRLVTWQTPTEDYAVVALTEANKAAPLDYRDKMRASASESDAWMRNVVKLRYGRRPDGTYEKTTSLEDAVSVRRHGAKPVTIELRNLQGTSVLEDNFVSSFAEWMPVLSRPVIRIRRTIARTLFQPAQAGAQATITDEHVRDWATGQRGVTGRPALIVGHWYDWGGAEPGEDGPPRVRTPMGEVELLMYPANTGVYAPCAQIDDTAGNAGYDDGGGGGPYVLTCYAHKHSESSETADAARFVAGDAIRIIEIDPADSAAPTTWTRTVASQSGNTITITAALSSPAWSTSLKYRVIYQGYAACQATQQTKVFQADDADGLIADTAAAYEYATFGGMQSTHYTGSAATDLPSRYAQAAYGDAVPLDTGYESDVAKLANNLISYKTAVQTPRIYSEERVFAAGGTWQLVDCMPFFFGPGILNAERTRKLYVGPRMLVSSGTGSVRVTVTSSPPSGATRYDVTFPTPVVQTTFTTTSATYEVKSAVGLDLRHLSQVHGFGFVSVEINANTSFSGFSHWYVGPLEAV